MTQHIRTMIYSTIISNHRYVLGHTAQGRYSTVRESRGAPWCSAHHEGLPEVVHCARALRALLLAEADSELVDLRIMPVLGSKVEG